MISLLLLTALYLVLGLMLGPLTDLSRGLLKLEDGEGTPYLSHDLASSVAFMEARGRVSNPLGSATVRELQNLSLLAEGKPYNQIAADLHVSYKTIVNTCGQLKTKLGVHSLPELMRIAIEHLPSSLGKKFKE